MNEKEFNRAIVAELAKIAKDYFAELSIPAGTYTASELANGKKGKEEIVMSAPDEIRDALHVVRVESFRCQFTSESVFSLLAKFEKLGGVGQKEKAHFVRMNESENVPCSFTADFGKGAKWAVNQVTKDVARFPMTCALLNVERGELVASDGYMLSVTSVPVTELSGELLEFPVLLNAEMIKNLKGKCHVRVLQDGITVEDESGKQYTHTYESCRYPNYIRVIPDVSDELRVTFTTAAVKSIFALLKSAKNTCYKFHVDINKGERVAKITPVNLNWLYEVPSIQVELSRALETDIHAAYKIDTFARAKNWDGNIWFGVSGCLASVLGDKCAKLTVMMPYEREDKEYHSYKPASMSDAFEAVCGTKTTEPKQAIAKPAKEPEKAPETPNLPAPYVVADLSAVSFFEHLSELAAFLFAFFFEAETRRLLARLQYLADLVGKPMADLMPEPSGATVAEPIAEPVAAIPPEPKQESPVPLGRLGRCWGGWGKSPLQGPCPAGVAGVVLGRQCPPVPPGRIVARTVFPAIFAPFRARFRVFAPPGIRLAVRAFRTRNRGAKRIVCRAALSPPRETHSAKPRRGMDGKANRPSRPPPETNQ